MLLYRNNCAKTIRLPRLANTYKYPEIQIQDLGNARQGKSGKIVEGDNITTMAWSRGTGEVKTQHFKRQLRHDLSEVKHVLLISLSYLRELENQMSAK